MIESLLFFELVVGTIVGILMLGHLIMGKKTRLQPNHKFPTAGLSMVLIFLIPGGFAFGEAYYKFAWAVILFHLIWVFAWAMWPSNGRR